MHIYIHVLHIFPTMSHIFAEHIIHFYTHLIPKLISPTFSSCKRFNSFGKSVSIKQPAPPSDSSCRKQNDVLETPCFLIKFAHLQVLFLEFMAEMVA